MLQKCDFLIEKRCKNVIKISKTLAISKENRYNIIKSIYNIGNEVIELRRYIMDKLVDWKNRTNRKPLILKGARQVGKTYILKEFGEENYENIAYFNFDHDEALKELFLNTKDPKRILEQLVFATGKSIKPEKTLIIFDEIQECPDALNSLKYFQEDANEYHIVCAGSLLGIKLSHTSFPVGKVDFLEMFPMTFSEFLLADGQENLVSYMESVNKIEKIPDIIFNQLNEKIKSYFIIGGMPEVVKTWVTTKDIQEVNRIQKQILKGYEDDFGKHVDITSLQAKISIIWDSIVSQLAKENKKFLYQVAKDGARAREYEDAVNWLNNSNIVNKIFNVTKPDFPLNAYTDLSSFKLYMLDVGLLRRKANLDSRIVIEGNRLFEEFKGALTENFVLNMLISKFEEKPNYYTFDRNEIDFVIQSKNEIIPVEVKSGENINNISLTKFNELNGNKISVRFSTKNLDKSGKILNIPIFMVEYIDKLIDIGIEE